MSGDEAVAWHDLRLHSEVATGVGDQAVDLLEAPFVKQQLDPLTGGKFAGFVLPGDAFRAPAGFRGGGAAFELSDLFITVHRFARVSKRAGATC